MSTKMIRRIIGIGVMVTSMFIVGPSIAEYRVIKGEGGYDHKVLVFGKGVRVDDGDLDKLSLQKNQQLCALIMEGKKPASVAATRSSGEREILRKAIKQIIPESGWEYAIQSDIENVQVTWANPRKKAWPRVLDKILCDNTLSGIIDWDNKVVEIIYATK